MDNPYWLPKRRKAYALGYEDGLKACLSKPVWEEPLVNLAYYKGVHAGFQERLKIREQEWASAVDMKLGK